MRGYEAVFLPGRCGSRRDESDRISQEPDCQRDTHQIARAFAALARNSAVFNMQKKGKQLMPLGESLVSWKTVPLSQRTVL